MNSEDRAEQAASPKHQPLEPGLNVHACTFDVVRIRHHSALLPAQPFSPAKFGEWVQT